MFLCTINEQYSVPVFPHVDITTHSVYGFITWTSQHTLFMVSSRGHYNTLCLWFHHVDITTHSVYDFITWTSLHTLFIVSSRGHHNTLYSSFRHVDTTTHSVRHFVTQESQHTPFSSITQKSGFLRLNLCVLIILIILIL